MRYLSPLLGVLLVGLVVPSPVFRDFASEEDFEQSEAGVIYCELPPEMDHRGTVQFVEDCISLAQYQKVPLPGPLQHKLGVHPVVCCPIYRPDSVLCFSSDAWCPTFNKTQEDVEDSYDNPDYSDYSDSKVVPEPTMADKSCALNGNGGPHVIPGPGDELNLTLSDCVTLARCPKIFREEVTVDAAMASVCGFDEDTNQLMVCCPSQYVNVTEEPGAFDQFDLKLDDEDGPEPRFPKNGSPRKCEDKVERRLCAKWRNNGGCDLDKDVPIDDKDPVRFRVGSKNLFDFMQGTCMETCDLCGRKGCVDELFQCVDWARQGKCVSQPIFMAHSCRESCGLCGFLSPDSKEEQVVDNLSYTDFTRGNFDCGRFKLLSEINGDLSKEECTEDEPEEDKEDYDDYNLRGDDKRRKRQAERCANNKEEKDKDEEEYNFDLREKEDGRRKRQTEADDVFFSFSDSDQKFSCGATIISDRWVVAAAHCYDDLVAASQDYRKIRVNTIRDNTASREVVEIKRVYQHPGYTYPNLYNDVAVVELGRRLEYNWTKFGDSPTCLDQGIPSVGKIATIQGYGKTETGDRGNLLETQVEVISNQDCKEILRFNTSGNVLSRRLINKALPYGLDFGLLCAQGESNEDGIFAGSCEGDSGGPLTTDNAGKNTLIGIVSGGIACGKGYPGWYTKVSFFLDWIRCIIDSSLLFKNNQKEIQDYCRDFATEPPSCEFLVDNDSIFGDFGGQTSAADNCRQYVEKTQSNTKI